MLSPTPLVMVVDDETRLRESLAELFTRDGYDVLQTPSGDDALARLAGPDPRPEVILLDLKMPGRDGIATLGAIMANPDTRQIPVIVVTSYGSSEPTISAMKAGAYDYITKPIDPPAVLHTVARAIEKSRLMRELERLRRVPPEAEDATELIGRHPLMREIFKLIGKAAPSDATVLITGESGTGKELVAQAIHRHSARATAPLVAVNCAAIPEALIESELFGYERGAFTGAVSAKPGRFELADGGTLFLDEIGDLPATVQVKLLRVLQERTFERLGGTQVLSSDFRLIVATNRDLVPAVAAGRFREDLFYRLNVLHIDVPPLRARRSDIPELAEHFLGRHRPEGGDRPSSISDDAMRVLLLHNYPGNVRELENLIQRAVVLARGVVITVEDLPLLVGGTTAGAEPRLGELLTMPLEQATRELEKILIARALAQCGGSKTAAARLLGIRRQHLYAKLKELGLDGIDV